MPFNSQSYYRNKAKREALAALADARNVKRRIASGEAHEREFSDVGFSVRQARSAWRMYLSYLRLDEMDVDCKRLREHKMTHAQFMEKWGAK